MTQNKLEQESSLGPSPEFNFGEISLNFHDLRVIAQKPGGSRPGCLVVDASKSPFSTVYMLKIETLTYNTLNHCQPNEYPAIESLSAQLIRAIWGKDYAADIRLISIPMNSTKQIVVEPLENHKQIDLILKENGISDIKLKEKFVTNYNKMMPYAIISVYEKALSKYKIFKTKTAQETRLKELDIIAMLLGISDLKWDNTIEGKNGNRKFVDCAADFIFTNKRRIGRKSFKLDDLVATEDGKEILRKFLKFQESDVKTLCERYVQFGALSAHSSQLLQKNIAEIRKKVGERVEPELACLNKLG